MTRERLKELKDLMISERLIEGYTRGLLSECLQALDKLLPKDVIFKVGDRVRFVNEIGTVKVDLPAAGCVLVSWDHRIDNVIEKASNLVKE